MDAVRGGPQADPSGGNGASVIGSAPRRGKGRGVLPMACRAPLLLMLGVAGTLPPCVDLMGALRNTDGRAKALASALALDAALLEAPPLSVPEAEGEAEPKTPPSGKGVALPMRDARSKLLWRPKPDTLGDRNTVCDTDAVAKGEASNDAKGAAEGAPLAVADVKAAFARAARGLQHWQ